MLSCPVCDGDVADEPIARYTATAAAQHFCPQARNADRNARLEASIRKLWGGEECAILHCPECDFMFGAPYVAGDEEFYAILHEQRGYPGWRYEYEIALELAAGYGTAGAAAAIDIGAGSGVFLDQLDQRRWSRSAIEGSAVTRAALASKGISVFADLASVPERLAGCFSLVTLFQVLEHLAPFTDTLAACRRLVHPQGTLVISVPDAHAMIEQERVTGCPDYPPNHINRWSSRSLGLALGRAGFAVAATIPERPSLRTVRGALHLRLMTDATKPGTLASHVYRLESRRLRIPCLGALSGFAAIRLLPNWRYFLRGGSFVIVARPAL